LVKVYLVEDSPVLRERVMESIAEDDRVAIVGYADTEDAALAGIAAAAPDAIILDIQLKRGSGINCNSYDLI
jgi:DNA-binding NarL/FixJ family response regulator